VRRKAKEIGILNQGRPAPHSKIQSGYDALAKRLLAALAGIIGGGVLCMLIFALFVSIFDIGVQSVMPGALVVVSFAV
jgi:hypothetical protein